MAYPIKCIKGKILADLIFPNRWAETQKPVVVLQFPNCPSFLDGLALFVSAGSDWLRCHMAAPRKPGIGPIPIPGIVHHWRVRRYSFQLSAPPGDLPANTVTQRMRDTISWGHLGAPPQWEQNPQEERNGSCKGSCPQYLPASLTVKMRFISLWSSNAWTDCFRLALIRGLYDVDSFETPLPPLLQFYLLHILVGLLVACFTTVVLMWMCTVQ